MGSTDQISKHPAETRMMLHELVRRLADERAPQPSARPELGPFITLSRQAGIGGTEIAQSIAGELGWTVLDRELVDGLARELELDPHRLELIDEKRTNWFRDTLLNLLDSKLVLQSSYVSRIGKIMALAAHSGRVVIVGRGGHLLLPRDKGLSVRIVARRAWRVNRVSVQANLEQDAAARIVDSLDAERADFLHRNFKNDPDDATSYDLIVDVSTLGARLAVSLICTAARLKGLA
jgi:cytidylate kinase